MKSYKSNVYRIYNQLSICDVNRDHVKKIMGSGTMQTTSPKSGRTNLKDGSEHAQIEEMRNYFYAGKDVGSKQAC